MPKRVKNVFFNKLKFKYMFAAYERAAKGKKKNKEVITYELDLAQNITNTLKELYAGKYQVGEYREFEVFEPKRRIIQSLPFKDRVVQQWYVEEFIKPIFIPQFIEDSYACLDDKGSHKGVRKLNKYLYNYSKINENLYILKCDIAKFFYNINKKKLYQLMQRKVKDKEFLKLTKMLIYHDNEEKGIPIGNYTSQYYANIYLNELDHYVKEKLNIKYYVRYMDDFILLLNSKEQAKYVLEQIRAYLKENLDLELNKKTNYFKLKQGVNFCGYKIYKDCIKLKKDNKKKTYKKIKKWNQLYDEKKLDFKEAAMCLNSWIGHAKNADTYFLIKRVKENCKWLYHEDSCNFDEIIRRR